MSNAENEPEVKHIERIEVAPAGADDETVEPETETQPDSSQEETNDETETEEKPEEGTEAAESEEPAETTEEAPKASAPHKTAAPAENPYNLKRGSDESDREWALRLENARIKKELRGERAGEIIQSPAAKKPELAPERKKVLDQYKPEDVQKLKEVFDVLAEDMGFVRKEALVATTYQEKATEVLDSFLESHPEYLPENDHGNVLWSRFKEEFGLYKQPATAKDLKRVLDKVHKDVFGIKPAAALPKTNAAKEKIKVASHTGGSRPSPSREGVRRAPVAPQGLRTDMLKGFSDEEMAELTGDSES